MQHAFTSKPSCVWLLIALNLSQHFIYILLMWYLGVWVVWPLRRRLGGIWLYLSAAVTHVMCHVTFHVQRCDSHWRRHTTLFLKPLLDFFIGSVSGEGVMCHGMVCCGDMVKYVSGSTCKPPWQTFDKSMAKSWCQCCGKPFGNRMVLIGDDACGACGVVATSQRRSSELPWISCGCVAIVCLLEIRGVFTLPLSNSLVRRH